MKAKVDHSINSPGGNVYVFKADELLKIEESFKVREFDSVRQQFLHIMSSFPTEMPPRFSRKQASVLFNDGWTTTHDILFGLWRGHLLFSHSCHPLLPAIGVANWFKRKHTPPHLLVYQLARNGIIPGLFGTLSLYV